MGLVKIQQYIFTTDYYAAITQNKVHSCYWHGICPEYVVREKGVMVQSAVYEMLLFGGRGKGDKYMHLYTHQQAYACDIHRYIKTIKGYRKLNKYDAWERKSEPNR